MHECKEERNKERTNERTDKRRKEGAKEGKKERNTDQVEVLFLDFLRTQIEAKLVVREPRAAIVHDIVHFDNIGNLAEAMCTETERHPEWTGMTEENKRTTNISDRKNKRFIFL